ncbi:MAG: AraC family transcriptional regulator [Eubacteriales bacterium]|nr:AraC family transcriptional regulator [Eubacteriales bacterium]
MKAAARRAIKESMLSGYRHHSYQIERQIHDYILYGKGDSSLGEILTLDTYADILAPDRLRAMKNALICAVAVTSRAVIAGGVENEAGFALSDYYVNEIEKAQNAQQLEALAKEMNEMFRELVQEAVLRAHSLPVARALRYISRSLYEPCRVMDVADHVGLNVQYFSALFKKEMNEEPSAYIRGRKMQEARTMLLQMHHSVVQTAEELGYCSASHFVQAFRKYYGVTPKQMVRGESWEGKGEKER